MSSNHIRLEDPRLVSRNLANATSEEPFTSKRSSRTTSESILYQRGQKVAKYDFNSNVPKRGRDGDHASGAEIQSRRRTRSQSFASLSNEDLAVDLSPKAHSESLVPISTSKAPSSPSELSGPSSSFLVCVVCGQTPPGPPLYGCDHSHLVCGGCREVGGALLSCPRCGSTNLTNRQLVAEELLRTELDKNRLVFCPYKSVGCNKITRSQLMSVHREVCLFRPVKCPKGMFSLSCLHIGPLCTIQQHARDKHNLHQGVTVLQPGLISSKMFDKSPDRTCCDDKTNAKFQPLELCFNDQLFYCYFERVVDRRLWFFFIRMFGREEQSKMFNGSIMIGHSALERGEYGMAGLRYSGPIANYDMRREEIRDKGYILAVPDEFLKSCKVGNVLFRVWFQVKDVG